MTRCNCQVTHHPRRVVLTGGPGAGKTALLELIRQAFCSHVAVLPEAASIIFGGGFPRHPDQACQRASQEAIYHVQRQLEVIGENHNPAIVLCDRGTLDGLAYWPGPVEDFWRATGTTRERELARYDVVIHLRTPSVEHGYNHQNPLRTESAERASQIDALIVEAWAGHPRRTMINSSTDFLEKAGRALALLREELPECCRGHVVSGLAARGGGVPV